MEMLKRIKIYFDEMMPIQQASSGLILALAFYMALARANAISLHATELVTAAISFACFYTYKNNG